MSRDGSGNFSLPEAPYQDGQVIDDDSVNANLADIADELTNSMARDGQSPPTANMPWGGRKITGLGAGTNDDDAVRLDQVAPLARPGVALFEDFGAEGDGVTDDAVACQAALDSGATLVWGTPGKNYYTTVTLTIPPGVTLDLRGQAPGTPSQTAATRITGSSAVSPVVVLGEVGNNSEACGLRNGTITRAGGSPNTARIGIKFLDGYNHTCENVKSENHGKNYHYACTVGISARMINCDGARSSDTYVDVDGWPELYWNGGRLGDNGSGDYPCTSFMRCRGGIAASASGPNTVRFNGVHFNQGDNANYVDYLWEFVNLTSGVNSNVEYVLQNCHVENVRTAIFRSDSTWGLIALFNVSNCVLSGSSYEPDLFELDPATSIVHWNFIGNEYYTDFVLAPTNGITGLTVVGGYVKRDFSLTAPASDVSTAFISGLECDGNITIAGQWRALDASPNMAWTNTTGVWSITATGNINITSPQYTQVSWTPALLINGSATGITYTSRLGRYQINGRSITLSCIIELSSKGAGTGAVTISGLPKVASFGGGGAVAYYLNMSGVTGAVMASIGGGEQIFSLYDTTATEVFPITNANLTNTSILRFAVTYFW